MPVKPEKVERIIALFGGILFLAWLVYRIALIFFQFPDVGGVEGNVIFFTQRILDGQPLYSDPEKIPYAIAQYSPLYYYVVAGSAKLAGLTADDILPIFITGRIIGLLFNLGLLLIIYRIARKIYSISQVGSLVVIFLSFILLEITSYARPDALYHFFYLLSLYFFLLSQQENIEKRKENTRIIIAALLAAMALLSKQSAMVLPFILILWLTWKKKYKQAGLFACCFAIGSAVLIGISIPTHSYAIFYKNVIGGINNGISLGWFRGVIIQDYYLKPGLIVVPLFILVISCLRKETKSILRISMFVMILQFVLANLMALKMGASTGYFTEWWVMVFILSMYCYEKKLFPGLSWGFISGICVLFVFKGIFIIKPLKEKLTACVNKDLYTVFKRDRALADKINAYPGIRPEDRIFLNFNTAESYLSNIFFRNAIMPQMDIVALAVYPRRKYDYSEFDKEVLAGRFKWMIMKEGGPQKQFFNLMLDKYELKEVVDGFTIYEARP